MKCLSVYLLLVAALLCAGCSSGLGPDAGGGSDLPNGVLAAAVHGTATDHGAPAEGATVALQKAVLHASTDHTFGLHKRSSSLTTVAVDTVDLDTVGADGSFAFDGVAPGRYALQCTEPHSGRTALAQFVEIRDSADTANFELALGPTVVLLGGIDLPEGYSCAHLEVRIPGTNLYTTVSDSGRYVLRGVPADTFDLSFLCQGIANYLRLAVTDTTANDTVFARAVQFAPFPFGADTMEAFHPTMARTTYRIVPKVYREGTEPLWYREADFEHIEYYSLADSETTRWEPDSSLFEYPRILTGALYRDSSGMVVLRDFDDTIYRLTGPLVEQVGSTERMASVAVRPALSGEENLYEVVGLRYEPSFTKRR